MWDLPGPGLEPMSPALAGGFLTTVPPGKSLHSLILNYLLRTLFSLYNLSLNDLIHYHGYNYHLLAGGGREKTSFL